MLKMKRKILLIIELLIVNIVRTMCPLDYYALGLVKS
jgi:hypothetical protein